MVSTRFPRIDYDSSGVAIVAGTTTRVAEIVLDHLAYGWHARQLQRRFPRLSMGQIHAALAYYYDREEQRQQAAGAEVEESEMNPDHGEIVEKLKCLGLLP